MDIKESVFGRTRERSGLLTFNPAETDAPPLELTNEVLSSENRRKHVEVVDWFRKSVGVGREVHTDKIAAQFKLSWNGIYYRLRRAARAGLVRQTRPNYWELCK